MPDDPIQALDEIDIIGKRRDGGVDFALVVSSYLDDTPHMEQLLKTKIRTYINAIMSKEIQSEFGPLPNTRYRIIVKCTVPPHREMIQLIRSIGAYLHDYQIGLTLEADGEETEPEDAGERG